MSEPITLILVLLSGFGLGILFYGGLWLTVRALPTSKHPVLLSLASFWGRTAVVIVGFTLTMARRWQNGVVFLIGFALARVLLALWLPAHQAGGRQVL